MTYAIYFELTDTDGSVSQWLFQPYFKLENTHCSPSIWMRTVTSAQPSRVWGHSVNDSYDPNLPDDVSSRYAKLEKALQQFEGISSYMRSVFSEPGWTIRGAFPLYLTDSNKLDMISGNRLSMDVASAIRTRRGQLDWPPLPGRSA